MTRAGAFIVALHGGPFTGENRHANGMAGSGVAPEESLAGRQRDRRAAEAGAAAFGICNALDGHRRFFDDTGSFHQRVGRRFGGIFDVEIRNGFGQPLARRQSGKFVLGRQFRHPNRAFGKRAHTLFGEVGGRDERNLPADKDAQAKIVGFRAFDVFELAEPVGYACRNILDEQGVGRIGTGGARRTDEVMEQILGIGFCDHGGFLNCPAREGKSVAFRYFHTGLPSPGRPNRGHLSLTVRMTSSSMRILRPQSRLVSGGHLLVASRPILEPSPLSGAAKSR